MKVIFTDRAQRDLFDIGDYVAQFDPAAARQLLRDLRQKVKEIGNNPLAFSRVPGHEQYDMRRRVYRDYLIFYVVKAGAVAVIAISHGARDYDQIFPDPI